MLYESSNIFQRIAIGWEQVAFDSDPVHATDFNSTKNKIRNVSQWSRPWVSNLILIVFIFRFYSRCVKQKNF